MMVAPMSKKINTKRDKIAGLLWATSFSECIFSIIALNLQQNFKTVVKIGNVELGEFPLLLAPMEDVSDPPFRAVCKEQGADLMFTEFISAEGLIRDAEERVQKL